MRIKQISTLLSEPIRLTPQERSFLQLPVSSKPVRARPGRVPKPLSRLDALPAFTALPEGIRSEASQNADLTKQAYQFQKGLPRDIEGLKRAPAFTALPEGIRSEASQNADLTKQACQFQKGLPRDIEGLKRALAYPGPRRDVVLWNFMPDFFTAVLGNRNYDAITEASKLLHKLDAAKIGADALCRHILNQGTDSRGILREVLPRLDEGFSQSLIRRFTRHNKERTIAEPQQVANFCQNLPCGIKAYRLIEIVPAKEKTPNHCHISTISSGGVSFIDTEEKLPPILKYATTDSLTGPRRHFWGDSELMQAIYEFLPRFLPGGSLEVLGGPSFTVQRPPTNAHPEGYTKVLPTLQIMVKYVDDQKPLIVSSNKPLGWEGFLSHPELAELLWAFMGV